jgi:hypothetical protein
MEAKNDKSRRLFDLIVNDHIALADEIDKEHPDEEVLRFLSILLIMVARLASRGEDRARRFFDLAQSMGIHYLPVHYYSPVPDTSSLPECIWERRFDDIPGWDLNADKQRELLNVLASWGGEMANTPADCPVDSGYCWNNPAFNATDAVIYHAVIRQYKPKRILEIGSGYSTLVAARAASLNGSTRLRCIEPSPPDFLNGSIPALEEVIRLPLQQVSASEFESLGANDILFVDSTHVSKVGSDVNRIFFEILPRLSPGVLIHFHDIFLPRDYPRQWVIERRIFWSEQYMLLAFLLFNTSFEVLITTQYLGLEHPEDLRKAFPFLPVIGGGSCWMRRIR